MLSSWLTPPWARSYTSVGTLTCHHGWSPGSYGHYQQDAELFASWGVDVSTVVTTSVLVRALYCLRLLPRRPVYRC